MTADAVDARADTRKSSRQDLVLRALLALVALVTVTTLFVAATSLPTLLSGSDNVNNHQCLDSAYKFAQTQYIESLTNREPPEVIAAKLGEFNQRALDLVTDAAGHRVTCRIDLEDLPGG